MGIIQSQDSKVKHTDLANPFFALHCFPFQQKMINKYKRTIEKQEIEFPKLRWQNFEADPDNNSSFHAHSYWHIKYRYGAKKLGDKVILNVRPRCLFENNRSWVKSQYKSLKLLEHEQGHYYIGCLCAMNFQKKVEEAEFTQKDYKAQLQKIFNANLKEYLLLEELYDAETDHFYNRENQKKWDQILISRINSMSSYWEACVNKSGGIYKMTDDNYVLWEK